MKPNVDYTSHFNIRKLVSWTLILTLFIIMFDVGAIAQVVLNLGYGTPSAGSSLEISWNQMDDADHYEYSVRNTTTDELIYDHKSTTSRSFTISGKYLIANNSYRVWVGAYRPEDVDGWPPSTHTAEWEFTVPDDTCYHEGKTYQDIIKKVYKSISDTQHRATTTYDLRCYDCDEILKESQVLEETEDHFLDENGDCKLCDYTHSCPHTQSEVAVEKSGYLTEDEEYHIYFETGYYVCANANCGKEIKPYYYETEEEHTFKNNTCKYCGYTKSEPLSITVARGQQAAVAGESIFATVTTKGGSGSFDYAWEVICDGTVVDRTDYSMSTDYSYITTKAGNWQFKVYVKDTVSKEEVTATTSTITVSEATCNHTNKKNETIDTRYIKTSDAKHEIRTYYNVVCNDCGDVLSEGNYSSEIVDHVVGSSRQCVCGYTAPSDTCEHTTSKSVQIDQRTEQYDEKWHKVIVTYQDICANDDCGIILVASRDETEMVAHTYDSNEQCVCGYVQPTDKCDHAPIETLIDTDYVEIDGTGHESIRKYHYECECGQVNYDEDTQSFDPHVYEGRICKLCGFENPCDHADFQKVLSSVVEDDKNSDSTHFVVTTYANTCACGAINPTPVVRTTVQCNFIKNAGVQAKHESKGHQCFDKCECGNAVVNGEYKSFLSSCKTCQEQNEEYKLIKELQILLNNRGYNAGTVDGLWGPNTKNAMNAFRADVMKLSAIEYVDDATMQALRNGVAADVVPEEKVDQEEVKPAVDEATLRAEYEDAQSDYKYASKDVTNSYLVSGTVSQIAKQNDALGGFSGTIKAIYAGTYKVIDQGVEVLEDSNAKYEDYVYDMVYNATLASLSGMTQGFGDTSNSTKTIETWKAIVDSADQLGGMTDSAMEIMLKDLWEYAGQSVADNDFSYKYGKWGINSVLDIFQKRQAAQEEVLHYFNIVQNRIYYAEVLDSVKTQAENEGNAVLVEVCSDILSEIDKEMANIKVDIGLRKTGEWIHDTTTDFVYDATNQLISNAISSANPGWWFVEAAHFVGELANTSGKIEEQENIIVIEALMDSMKDSKNNAARSYAETDNELFYLCMTGMLHEVGLQSVETIYGGFQWTDVFNLTDAAGTVKNAQAQQREISEALNSAIEAYYQMQDSAYDSVR